MLLIADRPAHVGDLPQPHRPRIGLMAHRTEARHSLAARLWVLSSAYNNRLWPALWQGPCRQPWAALAVDGALFTVICTGASAAPAGALASCRTLVGLQPRNTRLTLAQTARTASHCRSKPARMYTQPLLRHIACPLYRRRRNSAAVAKLCACAILPSKCAHQRRYSTQYYNIHLRPPTNVSNKPLPDLLFFST